MTEEYPEPEATDKAPRDDQATGDEASGEELPEEPSELVAKESELEEFELGETHADKLGEPLASSQEETVAAPEVQSEENTVEEDSLESPLMASLRKMDEELMRTLKTDTEATDKKDNTIVSMSDLCCLYDKIKGKLKDSRWKIFKVQDTRKYVETETIEHFCEAHKNILKYSKEIQLIDDYISPEPPDVIIIENFTKNSHKYPRKPREIIGQDLRKQIRSIDSSFDQKIVGDKIYIKILKTKEKTFELIACVKMLHGCGQHTIDSINNSESTLNAKMAEQPVSNNENWNAKKFSEYKDLKVLFDKLKENIYNPSITIHRSAKIPTYIREKGSNILLYKEIEVFQNTNKFNFDDSNLNRGSNKYPIITQYCNRFENIIGDDISSYFQQFKICINGIDTLDHKRGLYSEFGYISNEGFSSKSSLSKHSHYTYIDEDDLSFPIKDEYGSGSTNFVVEIDLIKREITAVNPRKKWSSEPLPIKI